jgi:hypothetical protein
MADPKITHCLVCDLVRGEEHGKVAILGFFGIAPDATVGIADLSAMTTVTFAFIGRATAGAHKFKVEIINAKGDVLGPIASGVTAPLRDNDRLMLVSQMMCAFGKSGTYTARFSWDTGTVFNAPFEIVQGPPPSSVVAR